MHHPNSTAGAVGRIFDDDRIPIDQYVAGALVSHPAQDIHQRRFPSAVLPKQSMDFAPLQRKINAVEDPVAAVILRNRPHSEDVISLRRRFGIHGVIVHCGLTTNQITE